MYMEKDLVAEYRNKNPKSRVIGIVKYIKNGGSVKQMGCVLCGERGPTWCGHWRKTMRAHNWEMSHIHLHLEEGAELYSQRERNLK